MSKTFTRAGGIFLAAGLLFAGIGAYNFRGSQELAANGVQTTGTVIDLSTRRGTGRSRSYRPVVEFFDTDGIRHEFTSTSGTTPPSYSRGETVTVFYDPDAPSEAIIDGFMDRYFLPLMFGGLGLLFALIGTGLLRSASRSR